MDADDDGFLSAPRQTIRAIGAREDDFKLLVAKGYVIPFETGVCVVKHWKMNNYLRADRYKPTIHRNEAQCLQADAIGAYTLLPSATNCLPLGIPTDNQVVDARYTQDRIGKDRIVKDSIDYGGCRGETEAHQGFETHPPATPALQCDAKTLHCNNSVTERKREEIDTEKDIFIADKPQRKKRFVPPTVEQVAGYVRERGSNVDPQYFVDFYESKGWMVGKHPMKDWKAACRNAERWERHNKPQHASIISANDCDVWEDTI